MGSDSNKDGLGPLESSLLNLWEKTRAGSRPSVRGSPTQPPARPEVSPTGREFLTLRVNTGGVLGLSYGPDGRRLASAGAGGTFKVWVARSLEDVLAKTGRTPK